MTKQEVVDRIQARIANLMKQNHTDKTVSCELLGNSVSKVMIEHMLARREVMCQELLWVLSFVKDIDRT